VPMPLASWLPGLGGGGGGVHEGLCTSGVKLAMLSSEFGIQCAGRLGTLTAVASNAVPVTGWSFLNPVGREVRLRRNDGDVWLREAHCRVARQYGSGVTWWGPEEQQGWPHQPQGCFLGVQASQPRVERVTIGISVKIEYGGRLQRHHMVSFSISNKTRLGVILPRKPVAFKTK
jgi:hypothetical protein